jgi:nitrogen fixation-related uncharacterized protein
VRVVAIVIGLIIVQVLIHTVGLTGYDDTDNAVTEERSGLAIRIDHRTKCQYLVTWLGGITPRMGADGKQVCK